MERFFSFQRPSRRGLIPLLLFFLLIPQASGIGVGASPDRIDFGAMSLKEGVVRELCVINTGDETGQILLTAEGVDIIMDPQEFGLGARQSRVVNVSIDQKEAGEYNGSILITTCPSGDDCGLGLGAGVRVPVSFVVKDDIYIKTLLGVEGALITIAVIVLLWMRRSKV
ncbi:MAG: hypothetical protein JRC86_05680 [Deltaproteobacteria bacterium]|nr:hypothetical protein [Deltaproteobacteria bacterium]